MVKFRQLLASILICSTLATICALAQSSLTQIRDLITNSDGTPFNGMVVITWNGFSVPSGTPVSQLSASARIYNGALSVLLVPTTTAVAGTYYQVVYSSSNGTVTWTETWQVPPSTTPLTLSQVRQSTTQGGGGSTASGSSQYATLPIAISEVTNLSSALSSINSSVSTLNTQVAGLATTASVTTLQNSLNGLSTTVTANTSSIGTLNTNVGTLTTNVSGLSTSLGSLSTTVSNLQTTVNGLSSGGGSSGVVFVDSQVPTGAINGTNTVFNLTSSPSPASSLALYRNGLLQSPSSDYTLSGAAITFLSASTPQSGDTLEAYYRTPGTGTAVTFVDSELPAGTINGTNLVFTLANTPNPSASLKLYRNGLLLAQGGDYTTSGATITFAGTVAAPQTGDSLIASYRH